MDEPEVALTIVKRPGDGSWVGMRLFAGAASTLSPEFSDPHELLDFLLNNKLPSRVGGPPNV